jgi:hypothetical protein
MPSCILTQCQYEKFIFKKVKANAHIKFGQIGGWTPLLGYYE